VFSGLADERLIRKKRNKLKRQVRPRVTGCRVL
jgi:hypothetical protein